MAGETTTEVRIRYHVSGAIEASIAGRARRTRGQVAGGDAEQTLADIREVCERLLPKDATVSEINTRVVWA